MKRAVSIFLLVVMFSMIFPVNAFAVQETGKEVIYLDNGDFIVVEIDTKDIRVSGSKSGSKTYTYYSDSDSEQWKAVLSGTFSYDGSTSTCTASSCSVFVTDTAWYTISKYAGKSGSAATASVTMGRKLLGITIDQLSIDIKLTCDANGNLS